LTAGGGGASRYKAVAVGPDVNRRRSMGSSCARGILNPRFEGGRLAWLGKTDVSAASGKGGLGFGNIIHGLWRVAFDYRCFRGGDIGWTRRARAVLVCSAIYGVQRGPSKTKKSRLLAIAHTLNPHQSALPTYDPLPHSHPPPNLSPYPPTARWGRRGERRL
jgi:hypothetical protein